MNTFGLDLKRTPEGTTAKLYLRVYQPGDLLRFGSEAMSMIEFDAQIAQLHEELDAIRGKARSYFKQPKAPVLTLEMESLAAPLNGVCAVCGRSFTASEELCWILDCGDYAGEVCEACLALGAEKAAQRVRRRAASTGSESRALLEEFAYQLAKVHPWPKSEVPAKPEPSEKSVCSPVVKARTYPHRDLVAEIGAY